MKNTVTKIFSTTTDWVCPAGVTKVEVDGFFTSISNIASSGLARAFLNEDGDVYAWGDNRTGALGDNTVVSKSTPILVLGGHKFKQICGGAGATKFLGVDENGDGWGWGGNRLSSLGNGVPGNGSNTANSTPTIVVGGHKWLQLSSGADYSAGLTEEGEVYTWGQDYTGALGHGTQGQNESTPIIVLGGREYFYISCGSYAMAAIEKGTKHLYTWGGQGYGSISLILGNGVDAAVSSPTLTSGGHRFEKVKMGFGNAMGVTESGQVYAWGRNTKGECGQNDTDPYSTPVLVTLPGKAKDIFIAQDVFSEYDCMMALLDNGEWYAWGSTNFDTFIPVKPNDTVEAYSTPSLVTSSFQLQKLPDGCTGGMSVLTENGEAYSWGNGFKGALGNNTPSGGNETPVQVISNQNLRVLSEFFDNKMIFDVTPGQTYTIEFLSGYLKFAGVKFTNRNGKAVLRYQA